MHKNNYISYVKTLGLFVAFIMLCGIAFSQQKFSVTVNKNTVQVGERFQVTFKIIGDADSFEQPVMNHFNKHSGPNKSSSRSWVNGRSSSSITYTYLLSASKEGKFTIGEAKLKAGKQVYKTKPIEITVVKTVNKNVNANQNPTDFSHNVFLKCYTTKNKAVVGEQIIATYKLYYNINLSNLNIKAVPAFTGFWSELVDLDPNKNRSTEVLNGVNYNVVIIHKSVLFPQRSGDLEADELVIDLMVQVKDNNRGGSIFDRIMGRYKNIEYQIESTTRKITVAPLPSSGKPTGFSGAVGKFSYSVKLDRNQVKANEAINLKISINGTGNLQLIGAPLINFPADFEVYDPKVNNRTAVTSSGVSGKKEFEYLIIPRHGGDFEIPAIEFTYYDVNKKKYITKKSEIFKIHVEKGDDEDASVSRFSGSNQSEINVIGNDIRYINTSDIEVREKGNFFFGSGLFYALILFPILLLVGFLATQSKLAAYNSNTALVKGKKANKIATKRLSVAQKHLQDGDNSNFYEEIFKAIYGYLGDKLNIDVAQLSKENIEQSLLEKQVDLSTIGTLLSTLNNCEMARFAPVTNISKEDIYKNAVDVISKIEEQLK
ncbi:MAG: protein BatD [Flavobacteriales bacterium]|nr:protein BatD [Flavobacteriales bacterium]